MPTKSNRAAGTTFEKQFCELLFESGFWAHPLNQDQSGQPADILAARNGQGYLIDCKNCAHDIFPLSRIEDNQDIAMTVWEACGNGEGWFALQITQGIYLISHTQMAHCRMVAKRLYREDIIKYGIPWESWVSQCR